MVLYLFRESIERWPIWYYLASQPDHSAWSASQLFFKLGRWYAALDLTYKPLPVFKPRRFFAFYTHVLTLFNTSVSSTRFFLHITYNIASSNTNFKFQLNITCLIQELFKRNIVLGVRHTSSKALIGLDEYNRRIDKIM